ncbi:hypothetical protein [Streptomyces sp. NBC_00102]|uniref:hypothetical protein n=1 Tax=Streptomyces sp. NBC_00102 TaxID=2975652 RepID=UPI002253B8E1|nr:hypothetical protein [Streptomyces sp. NBC_00102]MCX5400060.1 hypothetical protein [Streptomyces sp. NBC_00102]
MTEVSTEPPAVAAAAPPETPSPTTPTAPAPVQPVAGAAGHTAGGWPVVPLAVTGANSTVGLIAASAVAGGPVGAVLAAAGAALVGTAVAARHRSKARTARKSSNTVLRKTAARTAGAGWGLPTQGGTNRGAGTRSTGSPHRTAAGAKAPSAAQRSGAGPAGSGARSSTAGPRKPSDGSGGRLAQVKALREAARTQSPTRTAARQNAVQGRRSVADARRAARAAAPSGGPGKAGSSRAGLIARAGKAAAGKARSLRDAAVRKGRTARDERAEKRLSASRDRVRKAAVRRAARSALRRSAARKQGRRLLAALLAAPLGVVGMLSTPLGRKLGWAWLQQPGRRLYRHMMRTAEERKAARDTAIRARLTAEEEALDTAAAGDEPEIGDTVQRPFHLLPAQPNTPVEVVSMSGFRFEEAAAEMENAAATYEPENSMEILSMVENLPAALTSVANTFRILAERSDSEFPLEKDIAGAFDEIYGALMRAVDTSDDLGGLFRQVHEHDIARHEDPRNGPEAEKGWNV